MTSGILLKRPGTSALLMLGLFLPSCAADLAEPAANGDRADESGPCAPALEPFGGGQGDEGDPYLLCSPSHLQNISLTASVKYYRVASDIDLTTTNMRSLTRFSGMLDGDGYSIIGLRADGSAGHRSFITANYGEIRNLSFVDAQVVGASLLVNVNHGIIDSVTVEGQLTGIDKGTGGLAATNLGFISNVSVTASVEGSSVVGGVVGDNMGVLAGARYDGDLYAGSFVIGGIAGRNAGLVSLSESKGSVRNAPGVGRGAGGIVGSLPAGGVVEMSRSSSEVYTYDSAGGIAGRSKGGIVRDCAFRGSALSNTSVGGIVGLEPFGGTIENSYVVTGVPDQLSNGGFGSGCESCFFLGKTQSGAEEALITGTSGPTSPEDLADAANFGAFDESIWDLSSEQLQDEGHPKLLWETTRPEIPLPNLTPVRFEIYDRNGKHPQNAIFFHEESGQNFQASFVRNVVDGSGGYYATAVVMLPPGKHEFALVDYPTWNRCKSSMNGSSGDYETVQPLTVGTEPMTVSPWVMCDGYAPTFKAWGPYLQALATGFEAFFDDMESGADSWKAGEQWELVEDFDCIDAPLPSGTHAWHFGKGCEFEYDRYAFGHTKYLDSPDIAGISTNTVLSFESYRDVGDGGTTVLEARPGGASGTAWIELWSREDVVANDGVWEHVEIPFDSYDFRSIAQYGNGSVRLRFRAEDELYGSRSNVGWIIDDVQLVER